MPCLGSPESPDELQQKPPDPEAGGQSPSPSSPPNYLGPPVSHVSGGGVGPDPTVHKRGPQEEVLSEGTGVGSGLLLSP